MKEKKTTIPPAGAVKPTTANKKPLLMMALPIIVAVLLLFVPVPEGLPPYAWHYFAIFVGVIVGLIFEPLPGAVIGITGVVVIALCSQWLLFSPDQMAAPGFKMAGASFKWAVSGFGNSTVWLIFGAFMFAAGYDKTQFGRRLALILVKYLGRRSLTLGYAITFADLLLAPFTPSNTARSGGTIYPIIANLPPLYGSKPNDPSARKIGSYLMWVAITAACITSSMFLSALAPNLLALALVKSIVGINISWGTWFIAFLPLGILLILAMPLLAYWFYPPEVKVNNEVPLWATRELEKLGKLSRNEILLLVFVCFALMMWIFAADWIEPALAALLVIVLMLWTGVLSWSDITNNKAAWNTFVWFATLVALADGLSSTGFIAWLGIAISHYRFRRGYVLQGNDINNLPYRSGFFPLGPIFAFVLCLIITLGQNYEAFLKDTIDWGGVAATYIGIPLFLVIWFGYKLAKGTRFVRYSEMTFPDRFKR